MCIVAARFARERSSLKIASPNSSTPPLAAALLAELSSVEAFPRVVLERVTRDAPGFMRRRSIEACLCRSRSSLWPIVKS
eukprot:IDg20256t1